MKHSPGPWKIFMHDDIFDANNERVIYAEGCFISDEGRANASLIAAAPDLLMACKIVMRGTEWMTKQDFEFIKNAIDKAEGNL